MKKQNFNLLILFLLFSLFSFKHHIKFSNNEVIISDNHLSVRCSSEPKNLTFSGYNWTIRSSNEQLQGPGPNYFNDSNDNVWLDGDGFLHLKITLNNSKWYCAEIYSDESFGYGSYVFKLSPGFENLDVNVVVGLFTYLDDTNEIDIEFARWGQENAENSQFAVQPASNYGNLHSFTMEETGRKSIHSFTWCEEYIRYWSAWGTNINYNPEDLISEWFYLGVDNPEPSTERVHINLWLMSGLAPSDAKEAEIVIEGFSFIPSNCDDPLPLPSWIFWIIIPSSIVGISFVAVFFIKRKRD